MVGRRKVIFLVLILLIAMFPLPGKSSTKVTGQLPAPLKFEFKEQLGGVPVKVAASEGQTQFANLPPGTFKPNEYVALIQGGAIKHRLQADQDGAITLPPLAGKFYIARGDSPIPELTPRKLPVGSGLYNIVVGGKLLQYKPQGWNYVVTEFDLTTQQEKQVFSVYEDSYRHGMLIADNQKNAYFFYGDSSTGWGSFISKYQNGNWQRLPDALDNLRGGAAIGSKVYLTYNNYYSQRFYTLDGDKLRLISNAPIAASLASGPRGTLINYPDSIRIWDGTQWTDLGCPLSAPYNRSLTGASDLRENIWAWDGSGRITRYDGRTWTAPETPLGLKVANGIGAPDSNFWILGKDATGVSNLAYWDGGQWVAGAVLPGAQSLVGFDDAGNLYLAYSDGYLYQLPMVSAPPRQENISIQSDKASVVADGSDHALLSIQATGPNGTPAVDGTPITLKVIGPGGLGMPSWVNTDYVDDSLPGGAALQVTNDSWTWVEAPVYSGLKAHKSDLKSGVHQHWFTGGQPISVSAGGVIEQWIYIPSSSVPREIMLQFNDGSNSFEHRAYWGENLIGWGTDGTASRRYMGPIPTARDGWVKLEIKASDVGLEGNTITGVAYTLYDGSVIWDETRIRNFDVPKSVTVKTVNGSATIPYYALSGSGVATIVAYSADQNFMAPTISLDVTVNKP